MEKKPHRAITAQNILSAKIERAGFEGVWKESLGDVPLRGVWFISGASGSGKTTFVLQLAKYLTTFCRVLFNSLEMPHLPKQPNPELQLLFKRVGMQGVKGLNTVHETLPELYERLSRRKSERVVIIDSLTYLRRRDGKQATFSDYIKLFERFPDKLFIITGHAEGKTPNCKIGVDMRFHAGIKIYVEGFKAFTITRYQTEDGFGGKDYVIWEDGAKRYWMSKENKQLKIS